MPTESENPALADPKPRDSSASPQGTDSTASTSESENPALQGPSFDGEARPRSNRDWWPNQVDLQVLNKTSRESNPLGEDLTTAGRLPLTSGASKRPLAAHSHLQDGAAIGPLRSASSACRAPRGHLPQIAAAAALLVISVRPAQQFPDNATSTRPPPAAAVKQKYGEPFFVRPAGSRRHVPTRNWLPDLRLALVLEDVWPAQELLGSV